MTPRLSEEIYLTDMISKYGEEYDGGHFDTAADNYSFNVQGLSGAFVHKKNSVSEVILQSSDGVSVSRDLAGYTITDANGYEYQFQAVEQQTYFYRVGYDWDMGDYDNRPEHLFKYPSSWWLSSITSPSGETIYFYYTDAKIVYPEAMFHGYTEVEKRTPNNTFYRDCTGFSNGEQKADTVYKKLLNRIETSNSIVHFYYQSNSFPIFNCSPRLDSMAVFARSDLGKAIEKTKFTYGGSFLTAKSQLLELTKHGINTDEIQSYLFSYNYASANSQIRVNDNRQDHWGYFAPASLGTFSPKKYFGIIPNGSGEISFADRYANNATASNNMLSKITYPTGGSSEFVWEPHSYSRLSVLGSQAPQDRTFGDEITYDTEYDIEATLSLCGKSAHQILSTYRTINTSSTIIVDFSSYYPPIEWLYNYAYCLEGWSEGDNFNQTTIGDRPHILVKKDGQLIRLIHICSETYQNPITIEAASGYYTFELCNPREAFNFSCGGAQMDVYYNDYFNRYGIDSSDYGYVKIQIGHQTQQYAGLESKDVGGVRIKRITNKSENNVVLIKEYDYVEDPSDPQSSSSGVLAYPPRYGSLVPHCETVTVYSGSSVAARITDCFNLLTLRSNGIPYALNGGSHVEYSKVVESVVQSSGLLINDPLRKPLRRTVYSYWTGADYGHSDIDDTHYGFLIASDMLQLTTQNYHRGYLKEKTEYTDERKTSTYNYEILEPTTTETITGSLFTVGDYIGCDSFYSDGQGGEVKPYKDLGIVQYRVIPYNKRLKSVITEGSKSNDYQAYTYANNIYSDARAANAPLSHSTINSEGDTIIQHFTYVNVNLNRIHTCVTEKKGKIIDAYRNEYDTQGRIIQKYIAQLNPVSLPSANNYNAVGLTNTLIESYLYNNNRLVQLTDHRSGFSTVYLWSYNGTYPVAEIQNTTFANISNLLGSNAIENLYHTYTPNMNLLNGLRTTYQLQGSMVSTMTYKLLTGITSVTDPKGVTTYFDYNGFGQLKECYIMESGQKKIIQKMEYHWTY